MMLAASVLLGAICGLDVVSFPQVMISRPIVASTLAAAIMGRPGSGLVVGAILELMALDTLPFGACEYPEWGTASVIAGTLVGMVPPATPGAITACLLVALIAGGVSQRSLTMLRNMNARWARAATPALEAGSGQALAQLQLRGLTADFVRGGLLTAVGIIVFRPLVAYVVTHWGADAWVSHALVVGVAAMLAVGAAWNAFHTTRGSGWMFALGLLVGLVLLGHV